MAEIVPSASGSTFNGIKETRSQHFKRFMDAANEFFVSYRLSVDGFRTDSINLGGHPKPAIDGHLKNGQRDS